MISEEVTTKISKWTFSHPYSKFLATAKVGLNTLRLISWWRVTFEDQPSLSACPVKPAKWLDHYVNHTRRLTSQGQCWDWPARCQYFVTGLDSKFGPQLLSQCGRTYTCLSRSVSETLCILLGHYVAKRRAYHETRGVTVSMSTFLACH